MQSQAQIDTSIDNIDFYAEADIEVLAPGSRSGTGFSIASFVCRFLSWVFPLFAVCAIVFGVIGLSRNLKGLAIAGLSLGSLVLLLWALIFAIWV